MNKKKKNVLKTHSASKSIQIATKSDDDLSQLV